MYYVQMLLEGKVLDYIVQRKTFERFFVMKAVKSVTNGHQI